MLDYRRSYTKVNGDEGGLLLRYRCHQIVVGSSAFRSNRGLLDGWQYGRGGVGVGVAIDLGFLHLYNLPFPDPTDARVGLGRTPAEKLRARNPRPRRYDEGKAFSQRPVGSPARVKRGEGRAGERATEAFLFSIGGGCVAHVPVSRRSPGPTPGSIDP